MLLEDLQDFTEYVFFPDDFDILPTTLALEFYTYAVGWIENSVVALLTQRLAEMDLNKKKFLNNLYKDLSHKSQMIKYAK